MAKFGAGKIWCKILNSMAKFGTILLCQISPIPNPPPPPGRMVRKFEFFCFSVCGLWILVVQGIVGTPFVEAVEAQIAAVVNGQLRLGQCI